MILLVRCIKGVLSPGEAGMLLLDKSRFSESIFMSPQAEWIHSEVKAA